MWTSEPKGKLDVMTAMTRSAGQPVGGVVGITNGPQDVDVDWLSINWRQVTDDVRRLRQRIFAATQAGDLKKGPQPAHARGLLEPCAVKAASTVLRGPRRSMASGLPDSSPGRATGPRSAPWSNAPPGTSCCSTCRSITPPRPSAMPHQDSAHVTGAPAAFVDLGPG